jgi:pilus assembly protein CpaB
MSARNILFLAVAILIAGGTAFYVKTWIGAERARARIVQPGKPVKELASTMVLVAKKAMPAGTFVKPDLIEWRPWPEDGVIDGYIVRKAGADAERDPKDDFEGAVVRNELAAGQPITADRVVSPGDRGFLAAVLEPGYRAVSVPVNATTGIAGFIFPGDWVDVLLTMRVKGDDENGKAKTRYFSQTLLARIRVLAIDQTVENVDGKPSPAKTATIQVTPKQAEKVAIALNMGDLSLSLRSLAREQNPTVATAADAAKADGRDRLPPVKEPHPRSYTLDMDVYNMLGDPRLFGEGKTRGAQVFVLRGEKAETAKF